MNPETKIHFSPKELEYLTNTDFLSTKHSIISKTRNMFSEIVQLLKAYPPFQTFPYPKGTDTQTGKIAKGENYKDLPYIVLDFPRLFNQQDTFVFRTMLWWGHYFSVTMHLSGSHAAKYQPILGKHYAALAEHEFSLCINDAQWEHHFGVDNYLEINTLTRSDYSVFLNDRSFIKIGKTLPIEHWDHVTEWSMEQINFLLSLLKN